MGSINSIISEFGIVEPHITSDNTNSEVKGVKKSKGKRVECQAHIGNLAVQAGLLVTVVKSVLDKL